MHSSTSEDVTMDEAFEAPRSPPDSPSCGRLSQQSPSQTPKVLRDLLSRKLEDEFKLEPIAVLPSQREDIEETPTDKKYTSPATDLNPRKPNFLQPRYDRRWPPYEGVVAWWCKASGKGALVERGDGLNHDMMITIKLKDIKGAGYGALCPGSYVTYYRNDRGVWNFWVVTGHAYILYEEAQSNLKEYPCFREENYRAALEWMQLQNKHFDRARFVEDQAIMANPYRGK